VRVPQTPREFAIAYGWSFIGQWYKWGGDDPSGFDCSGFQIEILKAVGVLPRRYDCTAADLFNKFKKFTVREPYPGCLVFWENRRTGKIVHVEIMVTKNCSLGASGGGSKTLTVQDAIKHNAFIKVRDIHTRTGIFGFVDPFKDVVWS